MIKHNSVTGQIDAVFKDGSELSFFMLCNRMIVQEKDADLAMHFASAFVKQEGALEFSEVSFRSTIDDFVSAVRLEIKSQLDASRVNPQLWVGHPLKYIRKNDSLAEWRITIDQWIEDATHQLEAQDVM